jgi:4-amino-4-deoxy-L-arabinose transferase-like glycosyltransferase
MRAGLLLWGGWLVVTGVLFSFMNGIVHPYYTVALAPAVGALVGIGAVLAWRERHQVGGVLLSSAVAVSAVWAAVLLARTPDWAPWLRLVVLVAGLASGVLLLFAAHLPEAAARGVAVVAVLSVLAAPVGYALATAATPHTGAIPSAGPAGAGGGPRFFAGPGGRAGAQPPVGVPRGGMMLGGVLDAVTPTAAVTSALNQRAGEFTWVAAVVGSNAAAGYQLATGHPVLPLGGFNGTDPAPTLAQFQDWVRAGKVHYLIGGGLAGFGGRFGAARTGSDDAQRIVEWVAASFPMSTVDGVTLYDLTAR